MAARRPPHGSAPEGAGGRLAPQAMIAEKLQAAFALHQRGELAPAASLYREVLAAKPSHEHALHMLGLVKYQQREYEAAVVLIRKSIAAAPSQAAAFSNLALCLQELRRFDEALACCDRALALNPGYPEALTNRGNALFDLQRHDEALASYDAALSLRPDYAGALYNRGRALQELGRHAEALASYERALALGLASAEFFHNRGIALQQLGRHDEALASYDRALTLDPGLAAALFNRSLVLYALRRYEDAAASFVRLIERAPDHDYAHGYLLSCQMHCCAWEEARRNAERVAREVAIGRKPVTPFVFIASSASASAHLQYARTYAAAKCPASPTPLWAGERYGHDKIRVAYLSGDFRNHAVPYLMARLFERHDRTNFDITAVSFEPGDGSPMRRRLQEAFTEFIDVHGQSDLEVARALRQREVDIAVDLGGFTGGGRPGVLAHRPAPVQASYLGYPSTMGTDYIDYLFADRHVIAPEHDVFYAEKVVRLPDTYWVTDNTRPIAAQTPARADVGLPDSGFVFCCFNNSHKITPELFDVWMRLLREVDGSALWLLEGNAAAVRNLRNEAQRRGVAPRRLVFAPKLESAEHLARHRLGDLMLDTLPYNGHTTASDALWAGLPLVTCSGTAFPGRVAGSLLHAAGLPELITENLQEYEALALRLARTPQLLSAIRAKLLRNRSTSPLFDTDRFRRHFESAYRAMWERYQRGEPPESFSVQPIP